MTCPQQSLETEMDAGGVVYQSFYLCFGDGGAVAEEALVGILRVELLEGGCLGEGGVEYQVGIDACSN